MDIDVPDLSYLSDVYKTRNAADVPNAPPNIAAKKRGIIYIELVCQHYRLDNLSEDTNSAGLSFKDQWTIRRDRWDSTRVRIHLQLDLTSIKLNLKKKKLNQTKTKQIKIKVH